MTSTARTLDAIKFNVLRYSVGQGTHVELTCDPRPPPSPTAARGDCGRQVRPRVGAGEEGDARSRSARSRGRRASAASVSLQPFFGLQTSECVLDLRTSRPKFRHRRICDRDPRPLLARGTHRRQPRQTFPSPAPRRAYPQIHQSDGGARSPRRPPQHFYLATLRSCGGGGGGGGGADGGGGGGGGGGDAAESAATLRCAAWQFITRRPRRPTAPALRSAHFTHAVVGVLPAKRNVRPSFPWRTRTGAVQRSRVQGFADASKARLHFGRPRDRALRRSGNRSDPYGLRTSRAQHVEGL